MTIHAKLSPSKRHRWGVCPASVREEAKYPEAPSGPSAVDGTHTHTLLEKCIKEQCFALSLVGQTLFDHEGEFIVDAVRAERVDFTMNYIMGRRIEIGLDSQLIAEMEVNPAPIFHRSDLSGHVDVQIVGKNYLEVVDYKDGMAVVDAENNPQLEQYAFGCICAHQDHDFKTIRMTIIQPKLRDKGLTGISSWEISYDELMNMIRLDLSLQATATDDPNAPFNPGEAQCKYCAHKGACTTLLNKSMDAAGIAFDTIDVAKQAADKDTHTMTDQQLRDLIEAAPMIRQLIEAAENEALSRLRAGKSIEGLKVVKGRGSRAWAFPDEGMAEKLKKFGLPKDVIWETTLISPAKAEKVTWQKRDGSTKQLTDKQLALMESEYIKKSDGKLTVVSVTDSRPAVSFSVESMFAPTDLPAFLLPLEN
jgi:hypothetical protein